MIDDRQRMITALREKLSHDRKWSSILAKKNGTQPGLHLAVLREPYLRFILEGKKTIETRFAKRACPPYQRVSDGDVVMLKRVGGEIVGACTVEKVWFYKLDPSSLETIRGKFGPAICPADSSFWDERKEAAVATLMLIANVTPVEGIAFQKRDRRGWVVFKEDQQVSLPL